MIPVAATAVVMMTVVVMAVADAVFAAYVTTVVDDAINGRLVGWANGLDTDKSVI